MERKEANSTDILLLLEGTFPYVRGGVSSWIKRIIEGFPEYRFGIVFLGSAKSDYGRSQPYALPENVNYFAEYFLYDESNQPVAISAGKSRLDEEQLRHAHVQMRACLQGEVCPLQDYDLAENFGVSHAEFLRSPAIWDYFLQRYAEIPDQPPFVDYFWTIRGMHAPLWYLQSALQAAPQAKIFLSPSTGYAGYLGALLAARQNRPLIISEHGIYTKERRIDLLMARWIQQDEEFLRRPGQIHYLRQLWIHFFEFLGRLAYQQAWQIINLYAGVIPLQLAGGAPQEKLRTIPNGIGVEALVPARRAFSERQDVVALIGRVVPIKDIKTFIRAAALLRQQGRATQCWVVGPTEEDEEYFAECRVLVEHLGLQESVQFLGFRSVVEVLATVRLTILSSISEGLPLSVLESFAAGVPVVATDVGSCRQLLYGDATAEAERRAGIIVPIADPKALASAIVALLDDEERWDRCSQTAIARVESQYREEQMFGQYRQLFTQALME
ncbi:GT4 family glycosyltransferase PelF [Candidatus Igneacidithiobacillus taiwanensis]|uniref:GT4 family glycosyltransferase PelF n=1 Tax=Candidatus Igneacidithiobacillus taiwanensis TaxID=1945924 RepID=UPI00289D218D|nr:GT4 family glycosyltransferase PelF [Candidatus Igneacidithiobacillus taiwanensis]MCE5360354.1 GT4 family glycosyltransferase PelF [Acidithiobacillus sp.]